MHRDTDTLFALLLLVTGHVALMVRLDWGWIDLLLLDVWLVPLWFRKHPNCCAGKEQQSEAHEREGYPLENIDPGNAAADIEKSATDHDEFESARVDERLQKKLIHDPVSIGCVATPMIAAAGTGVHRPGPAAVHLRRTGGRVYRLLSDGAEHSTLDIMRGADVCAVSACISELRANGAEIACRQAVRKSTGERFYLYRLVRPVPADDGNS